MIIKHFDHKNKPAFIVDPYPGEAEEDLCAKLGGKLILKELEDISFEDLDIE